MGDSWLICSGEGANYGVDINTGGIADSFANFVWEPAVVKVISHLVSFI
jgi:chaperonin GroEL (HSP60 family)